MDTNVIMLTCAATACVFSIIALVLGFIALAKVYGVEKSTHSVQFMPAEKFSDWATPESEINQINEEFKEELEPLGL